jgi:deferrochelatase/peroxidase EfeB
VTEPKVVARPGPEGSAPDGPAPDGHRGLSRRALLGAAATGTAGLVVGGLAGPLLGVRPGDPATGTADPTSGAVVYPFAGPHQAGITTRVQDHLHFAAFDMMDGTDRESLVGLLRDWSYAAARMTQGLETSASGAIGGDPESPPDDTGEALDLPPSGLTVTIGFGPGLFEQDGVDRFGLAAQRPSDLDRLPPFVGDALKTQWSHGDLCLQVCADDPQVAVHAVRNLSRIAFGRAAIRWSQMGFGRTSKTTTAQVTPRNLMGFKDGTANILADDRAALDTHVWVPKGEPAWLSGGSYLVVRKIEMLIESWDRVRLAEQQTIIGRSKGPGAPLSGGDEFTVADFEASADGAPVIDTAAHVRLAHPTSNDGIRILRRGYNYVDGNTAYGRLDAGLFFLAYQRSPSQFIALQRSLGPDLLNEYIRHIGSAVFAIPPGASAGGFVGETLFG